MHERAEALTPPLHGRRDDDRPVSVLLKLDVCVGEPRCLSLASLQFVESVAPKPVLMRGTLEQLQLTAMPMAREESVTTSSASSEVPVCRVEIDP